MNAIDDLLIVLTEQTVLLRRIGDLLQQLVNNGVTARRDCLWIPEHQCRKCLAVFGSRDARATHQQACEVGDALGVTSGLR